MENENYNKTTINDQVVIFESNDGQVKVEVQVFEDTVWLTQSQIAEVFGKDRTVITKHIKNIFAEEELDRAVCAKFAHTASDGKVYDTQYYNLDMIISIGYRVNSKRGVQFRRWASSVLKEYLIKGYSINQEKIVEGKLNHLKQTVELLSNTLINQQLVTEAGKEILELITSYSKTWDMLIKYDEDNLELPTILHNSSSVILTYEQANEALYSLKQKLASQSVLSSLFGLEREDGLSSILGNLEQTYGGMQLYASLEEKAAHLLYFIIKDHPFSDGNKRIGSLLFLFYLKKAQLSLKLINAASLTALALLIAESDPAQKDLMVKLIINLITE
jgi:DNA ligase (NAD+)